MNLTIGHLYPELLNLYGDRGNVECLQKRCLWRAISTTLLPIDLRTKLNDEVISQIDILFMGGGEDIGQKQLYDDFVNHKGKHIIKYIEGGGVGLFICGGYQLLGRYYKPYNGEEIKGLNLLDLYTKHFGRDKKRCVGNIVCKILGIEELKDKTLVGFENHGGRTYLSQTAQPLGKTIIGFGNNSEDKTEGTVYKNTIGTYLHGPVLPKNPHLADWLIKNALTKKLNKETELQTLDDRLEWEAHEEVVKKYTN